MFEKVVLTGEIDNSFCMKHVVAVRVKLRRFICSQSNQSNHENSRTKTILKRKIKIFPKEPSETDDEKELQSSIISLNKTHEFKINLDLKPALNHED